MITFLQSQRNYNIIVRLQTKQTIYDYNVNMLRTTTECMSAIIGGADAVPIYLMMRCTTKTMIW
jgi:methylmalonyl-CoA mutase N-terminal domain/subunit